MSIELTFTEAVRKSKVKQPTQKKFNIDDRRSSFENFQSANVQDNYLYEAGIWFSEKFNIIRNTLKNIPNIGKDKALLLRLYTAFINREYMVVREDTQNQFQSHGSTFLAGDLIEKKSRIGSGDTIISPEGVIEWGVSAIRYPLSEVFNISNNKQNKLSNELSDLCILDSIAKTVNLAVYYDIYSEYWGECLWNDWLIQQNAKYDIIQPPDTEKYSAQVLSRPSRGNTPLSVSNFRGAVPLTVNSAMSPGSSATG